MSELESKQEQLVSAYNKMLERARETLRHVRESGLPPLKEELVAARDKAVELEELTEKEAERVMQFLHRDIEAAATFLEKNQSELTSWLQFDLELLEDWLAEALTVLTDHTRVALDRLPADAKANGWKTGEIVGPGTLQCESCRQLIHFHKTGHIPPCPKCRHSHFKRTETADA